MFCIVEQEFSCKKLNTESVSKAKFFSNPEAKKPFLLKQIREKGPTGMLFLLGQEKKKAVLKNSQIWLENT